MIPQTEYPLTEARNYRVVPLREHHLDDAAMLAAILQDQPEAVVDPKRNGFFWIDGGRSRFYVNVYHGTRTVYLVSVAHAASGR